MKFRRRIVSNPVMTVEPRLFSFAFWPAMLTYRRKPVCLSLVSTDLAICSTVEASATVYQKDKQQFHLMLRESEIFGYEPDLAVSKQDTAKKVTKPGMLWLEMSPCRVIMTMQSDGKVSYRHFWQKGSSGLSRYWLENEPVKTRTQLRMRNFTHNLTFECNSLPKRLRLEYELWSEKVQMGAYILNLEVD